jgi:hypothetical protein
MASGVGSDAQESDDDFAEREDCLLDVPET